MKSINEFGRKSRLCLNKPVIADTLKNLITKAAEAAGFSPDGVVLEHPADISNGDYSTNIALTLAKTAGKNPREIAEVIKKEIELILPVEVKRVEVAGAGFINFYLSNTFFQSALQEIISNSHFGEGDTLKGKQALFEYTDPNPFKAFHIGHLMANAIGESLSRLGEFQGAEVKRLCYQGDIGLHVAKTIWAMRKARAAFPHDTDSFEDKIRFMGDSYVVGVNAYEDDEEAQKEIKEINKKLFERSDADLQVYYDKGRTWSLEYFEAIYKKLNTKFDDYIFESEVSEKAVEIVKAHPEIFETSDGATVFKGEKEGLHTRVFLNSQGLPTYEAKDLANAMEKAKRYSFDVSVITSANEINDYFKVVFAVMSHIDPKSALKTEFVGHGMLRFADGKMSSRKGNIITGESFIKEIEDEAFTKMEGRDIEEGEKQSIATKIAIGAIKYAILRQSIGKDVIFDREKSLSFEGDSGPYLQYAYVRTQALALKADKEKVQASTATVPEAPYEIERFLYRFPEVALRAWQERSSHYITEYLTMLASQFSSFYASGVIVSKEADAPYKIAITEAVGKILQAGLWLLGISTVEKM
jgi:arginyl-tRNA synthetase